MATGRCSTIRAAGDHAALKRNTALLDPGGPAPRNDRLKGGQTVFRLARPGAGENSDPIRIYVIFSLRALSCRGFLPSMVSRFEVVERLAGAGFHPTRADHHVRQLTYAGVIRRGPVGRPGSSRIDYTFDELASVVLSLAAQLPVNAPQKVRRLAGFIAEPCPVLDELFALPEQDPTLHSWLVNFLQRLAELPREQRKSLYLAKVVPTLEFRDELSSPYPYADTARFEFGAQVHRLPPSGISASRRDRRTPAKISAVFQRPG